MAIDASVPRDHGDDPSVEAGSVSEQIRAAGRPSELDEMRFQSLRPGLEETWHRAVEARRNRRSRRRLALAASLLLAFALLGWLVSNGRIAVRARAETVAWITAIDGSEALFQLAEDYPAWTAVVEGTDLRSRSSSLALRTVDGHQLLLDVDTLLLPESRRRWRLESGAVFVDAAHEDLVILTPLGEVHHLGTRYLIRLTSEGVRAQVRDGQIRWSGRHNAVLGRGEVLRIAGDGGLQKVTIAPNDPSWSWIALAAPPFSGDGKSVGEVLRHLTEANGWRLEVSAADRARLEASRFHGSIAGLQPTQAAELVALSVGLVARVHGLTLYLSRSETDPHSDPGRQAETELGLQPQ